MDNACRRVHAVYLQISQQATIHRGYATQGISFAPPGNDGIAQQMVAVWLPNAYRIGMDDRQNGSKSALTPDALRHFAKEVDKKLCPGKHGW